MRVCKRRSALLLIASCLLFAWPDVLVNARRFSGKFDYYVLALSWSPTYCASRAGRRDRQQCGTGRGYAFVVHGLWPQYEKGWPDFCPASERYVPQHKIEKMLLVMPSKRLVIHEWEKHGTCSGLSQSDYFSAIRLVFSKVKVPARYISPSRPLVISPQLLASDFLTTNAWLEPEMLSIHCGNSRDRGVLRELRVCFDRDLNPRSCGANEKRICRARTLVMPPVR
jgi:ribonuclease T2